MTLIDHWDVWLYLFITASFLTGTTVWLMYKAKSWWMNRRRMRTHGELYGGAWYWALPQPRDNFRTGRKS